MTSPLLKLLLNVNRRVAVTMAGVAVCIMFLTGTLSLMGGLNLGSESLASRFEQSPFLVYDGLSLTDSRIPANSVQSLREPATFGYLTEASLGLESGFSWGDVTVIWVDDPDDLIGLAFLHSLDSRVLVGESLLAEARAQNVTLIPGQSMELRGAGQVLSVDFNGSFSASSLFPNDWVIVSETVFAGLDSQGLNSPSWLLLPPDSEEDAARLEAAGLTVSPTAGVVRFFAGGVEQAEDALWTVVVLSGGIIMLLVYNFLSVEVEYRAGDIRILRSIGGGRKLVLEVFLGKSLFVSLAGGILGLSFGVIAANAVVSVSELLTSGTFLYPQANLQSLGIPLLVAVATGLGGGVIPAFRAARMDIRRGVEHAS